MLNQAQRTTILELHTQGTAKREIARLLGAGGEVGKRLDFLIQVGLNYKF